LSPATENLTVADEKNGINPAGRKENADYRDREHLTPSEVEQLIAGAKSGRWGFRNATMVRIAYHHGLRAEELVTLAWTDINLDEGVIHITRVKGSKSGDHPLLGEELRALRRLRRESPHSQWCS
jgi:integrase